MVPPAPLHDVDRPLRAGLLALAAFLVAFVLYALTADGGPQWQDSGEMQIRILTGQLDNWRGLALVHAPHYYLGRVSLALLPGVEPARAITTIASGLPAAIGIACIVAAIAIVTRSRLAAILGGAMLMLSHTYWQHATVTECYGVTMACLGAEWLCLAMFARTGETRWLAAMAAANGFGITNHMLAALATPAGAGLTLWAASKSKMPARLVSTVALAWLVGLAPYLAMMSVKAEEIGVAGAVKSALVGEYGPKAMNTALEARDLTLAAGYVAYNFPNLALLFAVMGLVSRRWPGVFRWTVAAQFSVFLIFAVRYKVPDAYAFFFPAYMAIAVLAGLGIANLRGNGRLTKPAIGRFHTSESAGADFAARSTVPETLPPHDRSTRPLGQSTARATLILVAAFTAFWQPLVYVGAAKVLESRGLFASLVGNKPYRNGYTAFFLPWGCARDYAWKLNDRAFELAGPDGLILLEDEMAEFSLPYSQLTRGAPTGVTIRVLKWPEDERLRPQEAVARDELVRRFLEERKPVVLMPRDRDRPDPVIDGVEWRRVEDLYIATSTATSPAP